MVEIDLITPDNFLKIKETLTRCGIANNKDKILYQSCHILQKQGRYYITHFKELLKLDGREVNISDEDILRRNNITKLLVEWGLCKLAPGISLMTTKEHNFRVLSFRQKGEWQLVHKYAIGK